jgi:hypothetical protein
MIITMETIQTLAHVLQPHASHGVGLAHLEQQPRRSAAGHRNTDATIVIVDLASYETTQSETAIEGTSLGCDRAHAIDYATFLGFFSVTTA